jgi:hypothetical protein
MKKIILGLITCASLILSCNNNKENPTDLFTKVYTTDNLQLQAFKIDSDRDTILKSQAGTTIRILKNTFIKSNGQSADGAIEIEFKEALTTIDMVLANLTTTTDGKMLQTGGMIYINATSNGQQLAIAENKVIGVAMPSDTIIADMQLFEGEVDSLGINWKNPKQLINTLFDNDLVIEEADTIHLKAVNGKVVIDSARPTISELEFDNRLNIETIEVEFNQEQLIIQEVQSLEKGSNYFIVDYHTNYIFTIKKLGWANIDRLLDDPRTKEIEFITKIENHSDFNTIYVTMVTEQMFLPGYQMRNETFSFTHSDSEKPRLPIGASATIMATAYKNDKPYFSIKKTTISDKLTISLKLTETTLDSLKKELEKQL